MERICPYCSTVIPPDDRLCPNCRREYAVVTQVVATDRAVAAGGDINAPVFTGDIHAPVQIEYVQLPDVPPPPEIKRPPFAKDFIGREAELAYYEQKLNTTHLAVISGMPGVGKTALAAELARRSASPELTFWHTSHEAEGIDTLIWELAGFLARQGENGLWRMLHRQRLMGGQPQPVEVTFRYLLQTLRGKGNLLCFDDFQYIDDDPRLGLLIEELRGPIRVGELSLILTSRQVPESVGARDDEPLAGFTLPDIHRMLASRQLSLPDDLVIDLHLSTGGNAEFMMLAMDALQQTHQPARLIQDLLEAESIERYLLKEVDKNLYQEERQVMEAVALLLGYPGSRQLLEQILGGANIRRPLSGLSERYLLITSEEGTGRQYHQHSLVQSFYYDLLPGAQKREMHLRAAQAYEQELSDFYKAALHYQRAAQFDHAVRLVVDHLWELISQGQARYLGSLLERFMASQLSQELWVELNLTLGQVHAFLGEQESSRRRYRTVQEALVDVPDLTARDALSVQLCLGMGDLLAYEAPEEALQWLQRGLEECENCSQHQRAIILNKYGSVQFGIGNYKEALDALEKSLSILPEGVDKLRADVLMVLGEIYFNQGELDRGRDTSQRALEISQQLGDDFQTASILVDLGVVKFVSGDWQSGITDFIYALTLADRLGSQRLKIALAVNLGIVYVHTGDDEQAQVYLQNALDQARKSHSTLYEVLALYRLADLSIRQQDWHTAQTVIDEAERIGEKNDAQSILIEIYRAQAEAKLGADEVEVASNYIERSIQLAQELGEDISLGYSLCVRGQVSAAMGLIQLAKQNFEESIQILDEQDAYGAARTRLQLGAILLSNSETEQAIDYLQESRQTFSRLGARRDVEMLDQILKEH